METEIEQNIDADQQRKEKRKRDAWAYFERMSEAEKRKIEEQNSEIEKSENLKSNADNAENKMIEHISKTDKSEIKKSNAEEDVSRKISDKRTETETQQKKEIADESGRDNSKQNFRIIIELCRIHLSFSK